MRTKLTYEVNIRCKVSGYLDEEFDIYEAVYLARRGNCDTEEVGAVLCSKETEDDAPVTVTEAEEEDDKEEGTEDKDINELPIFIKED